MGVQGWYKVLRDKGYVPETGQCCSTSVWRPTNNNNHHHEEHLEHLERIPEHSELLIDGYGLAFHWHRVAYARHVATVIKRNRRKESSCIKLGGNHNHVDPTQVRRLLPNFLPLSQLSAVVSEFIKTLRDKHHMKITVYWDGSKRRLFKQKTDHKRQEKFSEEWSNLQDYCESGLLPTASTVCAWEALFPKNRLFQTQIVHTLESLGITSIHCEEEADASIAKAAQGNPAAFILGLDSDFCFFPNVQYIPLNTFDAENHVVTGVVLRRKELASTLGLATEALMTELAILLGNDYFHPTDAELDCKVGKYASDILPFLQQQAASFRVTTMSEEVEEILRFVWNLYELENLEEFPFNEENNHDNDDEAGDEILHLVSCPRPVAMWRWSIPPEVPLSILTVTLLDTSAKDAVLRCLESYLDKCPQNGMVSREHLDVLRKLPIDGSQARLIQQGDWRPCWDDVGVVYLVEKLLALVYEKKTLVTRMLPPFACFDQHKFHALMRIERGSAKALSESSKEASGKKDVRKYVFQKTGKIKPEKTVLPIDEHEERILDSIKRNRVTIIRGETGCGKSSRVPVMILRSKAPDPALPKVKLFMSQPRRIAAKGLVERVRSVEPDLRDQIALRMGHGVREYETKTTRAWFVTTGYLVRAMTNNMEHLRDVSHLIIDEAHERSVDTDILCLLCRRLLKTNNHVRLVLMSATLCENIYEAYFGAPEPPLVVGAKRYPVTEVYLDDIISGKSGYKLPAKVCTNAQKILVECNQMQCRRTPNMRYMEKLCNLVTNLVATIAEQGTACLIFVPGMNEIVGISELIEQMFVPGKRFTCIPVHSDIPFEDQMKVFDHADEGECRVILATNSAESSVTLPALNHVICLGLAKQITYNEFSHRQMLEPVWISRASATQRAGRTGRIAPGTVFRLYSRECFDRYMTSFEPGEMVRIPLDTVILTLKEMMADDEKVTDVLNDCIEPPHMGTIERSYKSLHKSHFITRPDDFCKITNMGSFALALGIDLTLASLIGLGIQFGVGREAIQMASIFSFPKTPWQIPNPLLQSPNAFNAMVAKTFLSKEEFDTGLFSEPLATMNLLWSYDAVSSDKKAKWCWENGISHQRLSRLASTVWNIRHRVSTFLHIPYDNLELECPPKVMSEAKITLLRVVQTWVFSDSIIECKMKHAIPPDVRVELLSKTDSGIDERVLDTIFVKPRHEYWLIYPKETEQLISATVNYGSDYFDRMEKRALSFATEKQVALVWIWSQSSLDVYFSQQVVECSDSSPLVEKAETLFQEPEILVPVECKKKTKRGIEERPCGRWLLTRSHSPSEKCFFKFSSSRGNVLRKKALSLVNDIISFVMSSPQFDSLSIDASQTDASHAQPMTKIVAVSRGSHAHDIVTQDLKDLLSASGEIEVMTKRKSKNPVLVFPATRKGTSSAKSGVRRDQMLTNAPEALRLLSVLASRRRTHNVIVELDLDDDVEEVSESDLQMEIYPDPKVTQLSHRWTRFGTDGRVYVEENNPVAAAIPVAWTGTLFGVCANALEIKGGALKAEGLTLLPPSKLFLLLSKVAFGLLKSDPHDEQTIRQCLSWLSHDTNNKVNYDDAIQRIRAAAQLHESFNADEELVCLPSSVESLLAVFDGLDGIERKVWDSLSKDPFIPN